MNNFLPHVVDDKQNIPNHSKTANKKAKKSLGTDPFSSLFNDQLQAGSHKNSKPEERKSLLLSGGRYNRSEQKEKKDSQTERTANPDGDQNRNRSPIKANHSHPHANTSDPVSHFTSGKDKRLDSLHPQAPARQLKNHHAHPGKNSHDLLPDTGKSNKKSALSANQEPHQKDLEREKKNRAEIRQTGSHKNRSDLIPVVETGLDEASMGANLIGPSKKQAAPAVKEDGKNEIKPKKAYSLQSAPAKPGPNGALEHVNRSDEAKRPPISSSDGQKKSRITDRATTQKLSANTPDKADHESKIKDSGAAHNKSQLTDQTEKAGSARFEQHKTKEPKKGQPHSLRQIGGIHSKDAKTGLPNSSAKTETVHAANDTETRKGEKAPETQSSSDRAVHHQMHTEEAQRAENTLPGTADVSSEGYSEGDGELQNVTQEEGSPKGFEEPKEDAPSGQAKPYRVDLKLQDVSISAKIRNQTLSLLVNLDSNLFVHEGLKEEIRAILHENGFKSYRLTIKEKTKKTYLETAEKATPTQQEKSQIYVKA